MKIIIENVIKFINIILFKENKKDTKILSVISYVIMIGALILGYLIAFDKYQSFNFFINEGIVLRTIKVVPLVAIIIYSNVKIMPEIISSLSNFYIFLFIVIGLIPMLIVYALNGIADSKGVIIFIYLIPLITIMGIYGINKMNFKFPQVKISKKTFWIGMIVFNVFAYVFLMIRLGFPSSVLNAIKDVYGVRLDYRNKAGRFEDYFIQWLGNVINPFLFAYALRKKKYYLALFPIFLQTELYAYTAYKSLFLTLFLAPFFGYVISKGIKRIFLEVSIVMVMIVGTTMGYFDKLSLYLMAMLRTFLWPPLIGLEYYDFFAMYPKIKLSHSILGKFFTNVYGAEPSFYMGSVYYNRPEMRLNVSWYGDAYMNFGYAGLIVFGLLLLFVLLIIKNFEKKDIYLASALLFGGLLALFNGPILTTLLTNGLGIGILILYLMPKEI